MDKVRQILIIQKRIRKLKQQMWWNQMLMADGQ